MGHRILYIPKSVSGIYYPEYGLLYNKPSITDVKKITSSDNWNALTKAEWDALKTYCGNTDPNVYLAEVDGGTNDFGLNLRFGGYRRSTGVFEFLTGRYFGISTTNAGSFLWHFLVYFTYINTTYLTYTTNYSGASLRLKRTSTTLSNGQSGTYSGNDGKLYRTICINGVEYLADNLAETRFRDGSIIPWYGANQADFFTNAEWAALTTAGCSAYNNDVANVAPDFSFPT